MVTPWLGPTRPTLSTKAADRPVVALLLLALTLLIFGVLQGSGYLSTQHNPRDTQSAPHQRPLAGSTVGAKAHATLAPTWGIPVATQPLPNGTIGVVGTVLVTSTASPTPSGIVTLSGTVSSVDAATSTFGCQTSSGTNITVVTTNQTEFSGKASQVSDLYQGEQVTVTGGDQPDGAFLATQVQSRH
jgi:hypothetical protein